MKKIERYKISDFTVNKDITYEAWGILNHPLQKGFYFSICDKKYGFYGERSNLPAEIVNNFASIIIAAVIGAFSKFHYPWIIQQLIKSGGCGENDSTIGFDREKNKAYFYFSFDENRMGIISYTDAVKLFYFYFKALKKFIEEYAKESQKEDWYKEVLEELPRLNQLYEEVVEKKKNK